MDIPHRRIHVHQSGDKKVKGTKTGKARQVQIVPALVPLLEAMYRKGDKTDRVFGKMFDAPALQLRTHLLQAGLDREALFTTDKTRRAIRAQDARASTATWLGILMQLPDAGEKRTGRRVEPFLIKEWLGHGDLKTTETHYLRGQGLRVENVGVPFGPLPADLLGAECSEAASSGANSCHEFLSGEESDSGKHKEFGHSTHALESQPGTRSDPLDAPV